MTVTDASTFQSLHLHEDTLRAVTEAGYSVPTPVQVAAFGPMAEGRDVVVQSRTGSGKTAAFVLPIVDRILKPEAVPQVLVLCPTRELAIQVAGEFERLGKYRHASVVTLYGGVPMERQVRALEAGVKVVVGTPGRVLDHLRRGTFDPSRVRVVVLDEGDEMLSMGFAEELHAILDHLPRGRQGVILSATMPDAIQRIASRYLREPEHIALSADGIAPEGLVHLVYFTAAGTRVADLVRVLEQERPEAALIFCNTKSDTEAVARGLQAAGFDAEYLHGDLAQADRERVLGKLRDERVRFLVATDVAARGIDVPHLTHVVNFGLPESAESYVHRTGRTGRAGRVGTAITLAGPRDIGSLYFLRLTYGIRPIERHLPTPSEEKTRRDLDRLQFLLEAFPGTPSEDAVALTRRILSHDEAERVVASLVGAFFDLERRDRVLRALHETPAEPPESVPTVTAPEATSALPVSPPAAATRRTQRSAERATALQREPSRRSPTQVTPSETPGADEDVGPPEAMEELRIAVGRREGLRASELVKMLSEVLQVPRRAIGRVHVRDRFTLVHLPAGKLTQAIEALQGVTYNNQPLAPERGRRGASRNASG